MNDALQQRILRRLEALNDEQGYRVLDYVEFLESKYASRGAEGGLITRLTEAAEDTMRAAGVPLKVVTGTMGIADSATRLMRGVAAAASAAVEEAAKAAKAATPPASPNPREG